MSSSKRSKGIKGENLATNYLKSLGWEIRERNYRSGRNEIDIIAYDPANSLLVFVEVKWRKNAKFGYPEEFASQDQMERIADAAEEYIFKIDWKKQIRFDIVALLGKDLDNIQLEHFKDIIV